MREICVLCVLKIGQMMIQDFWDMIVSTVQVHEGVFGCGKTIFPLEV